MVAMDTLDTKRRKSRGDDFNCRTSSLLLAFENKTRLKNQGRQNKLGKACGIALIVIGLVLTFGGEAFTTFFEGRFNYNGWGNILGQIWSGLGAVFNNGNNVCVNLQNAITISEIGLYIGVLMMIGGIIALTVSLARRNRRQENLSYRL